MNLIASKFRFGTFTRDHNCLARCVDFDGVPESNCYRQDKQLLKHFNHVVIRVLIVVEQYDVKQAAMLFRTLLLLRGPNYRSRQGALSHANDILLDHTNAVFAIKLLRSGFIDNSSRC